MDCLEEVEPDRQLATEIDHSAGHAKFLPDGLNVSNMNVKYGGKQRVVRDSVMTEGCLGPGEAKMYLNSDKWSTQYDPDLTTRVVDMRLKLGDVQSMSFHATDPPHFYDLAAPPKDKKVVKRDKNEHKEGYVGKAKGIKQVLWAREPKYHPEVAGVGIEYSWGMSKFKFRRELNDEIAKHLHQTIVLHVPENDPDRGANSSLRAPHTGLLPGILEARDVWGGSRVEGPH